MYFLSPTPAPLKTYKHKTNTNQTQNKNKKRNKTKTKTKQVTTELITFIVHEIVHLLWGVLVLIHSTCNDIIRDYKLSNIKNSGIGYVEKLQEQNTVFLRNLFFHICLVVHILR